jgi:hypothetical protein
MSDDEMKVYTYEVCSRCNFKVNTDKVLHKTLMKNIGGFYKKLLSGFCWVVPITQEAQLKKIIDKLNAEEKKAYQKRQAEKQAAIPQRSLTPEYYSEQESRSPSPDVCGAPPLDVFDDARSHVKDRSEQNRYHRAVSPSSKDIPQDIITYYKRFSKTPVYSDSNSDDFPEYSPSDREHSPQASVAAANNYTAREPQRESRDYSTREPQRESRGYSAREPQRESRGYSAREPQRESMGYREPQRESRGYREPVRESRDYREPVRESRGYREQSLRESRDYREQPVRESRGYREQPVRESRDYIPSGAQLRGAREQPVRESRDYSRRRY